MKWFLAGALAFFTVEGQVIMLNPTSNRLKVEDVAGQKTLIRMPPEFDLTRLRLGDQVIARCLRGKALEIGKALPADGARLAPADEGGAGPDQRLTLRVHALRREEREVLLLAEDGTLLHLLVEPAARGFDETEPGDVVSVRYVEPEVIALAVDESLRL
ncbi:MAG: hypothetical protein HYZ75_01195 [Elusimicrobia bacterium]|nr:hypothetical protein [Elusimicrobiota bacterium]